MSVEVRRLKGFIQRILTPKTRFVRKKINGHNMILDLNDVWMRDNYLWTDIYEPETTAFIEQNVRQYDVVLDIGAHIGYHTLNFVEAGARVYAYEPDSLNYRLLSINTRKHIEYCGVFCYDCVVSDVNGKVILYKVPNKSAWNSIIPQQNSIPHTIQSITIDSLNFERIDFIKIDVEGAEFRVLQGMKETIKKFPNLKLIIEWLPKNSGNFEGIMSIFDDWNCRPLDHNMLFWKE